MVRRRKSIALSRIILDGCYSLEDGTIVLQSGVRQCVVQFGKPIRAKWSLIGEHYLEGCKMKRREAQDGQQGKAGSCGLSDSARDLTEFLTETVWDDGKPRETGTVLIFVQEGRWKACMNDRDADASCFVSAATLTGLLEALDAAVNDPSVEWRERNAPRRRR